MYPHNNLVPSDKTEIFPFAKNEIPALSVQIPRQPTLLPKRELAQQKQKNNSNNRRLSVLTKDDQQPIGRKQKKQNDRSVLRGKNNVKQGNGGSLDNREDIIWLPVCLCICVWTTVKLAMDQGGGLDRGIRGGPGYMVYAVRLLLLLLLVG